MGGWVVFGLLLNGFVFTYEVGVKAFSILFDLIAYVVAILTMTWLGLFIFESIKFMWERGV